MTSLLAPAIDGVAIAGSLFAIDRFIMPLPGAPVSQPLIAVGVPAMAVASRLALVRTFPKAFAKITDMLPPETPVSGLVGAAAGAGAVLVAAGMGGAGVNALRDVGVLKDAAFYGLTCGLISTVTVVVVDSVTTVAGFGSYTS